MAAAEFLSNADWQFWVPVVIAAASLLLSWRQMRKSSARNVVSDLEKKIDRAITALSECEENLKQCGREKDELRRENVELLRQVAKMASSEGE